MGQMTLLRITPVRTLNFSSTSCPKYSSKLTLDNISTLPVAFKIKTTAPKNYLVRPSAGILLTQQTKEIELLLEKEGEISESSRDRFLIQAVPVDADIKTLSKDFWTDIPRDIIQHHRLNVAFCGSEVYKSRSLSAHQSSNGNKATLDSLAENLMPSSQLSPESTDDKQKYLTGGTHRLATTEQEKVNYNELLQYCLAVESQKKNLAVELEATTQQIKQLKKQLKDGVVCNMCGGPVATTSGLEPMKTEAVERGIPILDTIGLSNFPIFQCIALIVFILTVLKLLSFI